MTWSKTTRWDGPRNSGLASGEDWQRFREFAPACPHRGEKLYRGFRYTKDGGKSYEDVWETCAHRSNTCVDLEGDRECILRGCPYFFPGEGPVELENCTGRERSV